MRHAAHEPRLLRYSWCRRHSAPVGTAPGRRRRAPRCPTWPPSRTRATRRSRDPRALADAGTCIIEHPEHADAHDRGWSTLGPRKHPTAAEPPLRRAVPGKPASRDLWTNDSRATWQTR